ncbi:MAG: tetratricopeptide repeat protein [Gemmataceae bacterium]|nr:tetratricopeptide repeat protein [Gemmataceae bacterium]
MTEAAVNPAGPNWAEALRLLEQAQRASSQDPQTLYLLAVACRKLGRSAEARQYLQKISQPDASVLLQRGLLSFQEKDYPRAAEEFAAAWEKTPESYSAGYNLFLARLYAGQFELCRDVLMPLAPLAPTEGERRFLTLLRALFLGIGPNPPAEAQDAPKLLAAMTADEEARLLEVFAGLGQFEIAYQLLSRLVSVRSASPQAFAVWFGAVLVQAKQLVEKNQWEEAKLLLTPLRRRLESSRVTIDPYCLISLYQMLGVCNAMLQDFDQAASWFRLAQEICARDAAGGSRSINAQGVPLMAWIEQNIALVMEWLDRSDQAEAHWLRYVDLLERHQGSSRPGDYLPILAFEALIRLGDQAQKKERWSLTLEHLQKAHRFRPTDYETLERLFNLFTQLRRHDDARRVLQRMRDVRPNDPQVDLFELEARDLRSIADVDKALNELKKTAQKNPSDLNVNDRMRAAASKLFQTLERFADQNTAQVNKVVDQMRRLPSYQVNWPVVRDVMRDLEDQFADLRDAASKMLTIATDDLRRDLQRLISHCDRKMDQCRTLGR